MQVTAEQLLGKLPPFRNERILVKKDQKVNDIIRQILMAHEKYAHYYDLIAGDFDYGSNEEICNALYNFVKKNVKYREESEDEQTTALPGAILSLREGDCKHYSLFTAGVLDALKRRGRKINWVYRFASYKAFNSTPHHVFVVVKDDDGSEIWIDAVPGANKLIPTWQIDKTLNTKTMPLYDVVGNVGNVSIGWTPSIADKLTHSAAKVSPLMIAGRTAFLQMLKLNVRAWAKNLRYALDTQGMKASDAIGYRWYLLGGQWDNIHDAINEGATKKMLGSFDNDSTAKIGEPVSITALLAAAAPIIIAMTSMVKSLVNKNDWQEGQPLPGMAAFNTTPGSVIPSTGTGTDFLKNPLVLAGGAALAFYLYKNSRQRRVSGKDDNTIVLLLLLAGGAYWLHQRNQQTLQPSQPEQPTTKPTIWDRLEESGLLDNAAAIDKPIYNSGDGGSGFATGGGGGGGDVQYLKQIDIADDAVRDYAAMM